MDGITFVGKNIVLEVLGELFEGVQAACRGDVLYHRRDCPVDWGVTGTRVVGIHDLWFMVWRSWGNGCFYSTQSLTRCRRMRDRG